jgi:hypothetical protein
MRDTIVALMNAKWLARRVAAQLMRLRKPANAGLLLFLARIRLGQGQRGRL